MADEQHSSMTMLGDILADADSTHDIGDSTNFFKDAYIDKVFVDSDSSISIDGSGNLKLLSGADFVLSKSGVVAQWETAEDRLRFIVNGTAAMQIFKTAAIVQVSLNLEPSQDSAKDLGATSKRWQDFYIAGNITDDTTTTAITDILNAKRYALLVS